ncbi:MAG: TonB-dependent receptor [Tardiphaga sp.]|nr:TonB-dependent receptor [Tardiphaga sp.]
MSNHVGRWNSARRVVLLAGVCAAVFDARSAQAQSPLPPVTVTAPDVVRRAPAVVGSERRPRPSRAIARRSIAAPAGVSIATVAASLPGRGGLSASVSALPAATTVIDAGMIARAPVATYTDLFRSLPGFNVANFGQGGIASGMSLRGYTEAEHGRDIAYFIDGVPLNEVSSLHTPNYADLNILLPETVKTIEIVRGPFSVEAGDSNLGGSVYITTKDAEPFGSVGVSGGTQGTARAVATYSTTQSLQGSGAWLPYLAFEGYRTDGSRDNAFVERLNSFNKITTTLPDGATLSLRAQAYATTFGAPGYASRDGIANGTVNERSATNRTDGGDKQLETIVAAYASGARDQELKGTLFVSHDTFNRYADFGGGQRWQRDDRVTAGGRISKLWSGAVGNEVPVQVLLGGNWRTDVINAFQAPTTARRVSGAPGIDLGVTQHNIAGFGQIQIKPADWLKLTAGGRVDQFFYDISDRLTPGGTPDISNAVASPKLGIAITPVAWLELFANYGQGFRSIDVPLELVGNPGIQPFELVSAEGGAQLAFDRFRLLGSYWTTESANEAFQAAPGLPVTFLGKAQRDGFDLDGRFDAVKDGVNAISLFANYGGVRARLLDAAPSFFVPNVPSYVANVGLDFNLATRNAERLSGSAYVTFVGKKNLTQDGLITTRPYSRVTGKLAYTWPEGWTAFSQATWYPGDRLSEIAINFGDPTGASSRDIFVSAQPALVLLAGVSYRFPTMLASAAPLVMK